jgi:hypothetical protein
VQFHLTGAAYSALNKWVKGESRRGTRVTIADAHANCIVR